MNSAHLRVKKKKRIFVRKKNKNKLIPHPVHSVYKEATLNQVLKADENLSNGPVQFCRIVPVWPITGIKEIRNTECFFLY